jgi:hypothetical protein
MPPTYSRAVRVWQELSRILTDLDKGAIDKPEAKERIVQCLDDEFHAVEMSVRAEIRQYNN